GAGLGGDERKFSFEQAPVQRLGHAGDFVLIHHSLHGRRTVAVAIAAMPSPRPMKPSFSIVVAFTLTRPASMPAIAAMFRRIASACGAIFGASQSSVASSSAMRPPRAAMSETACARKRSDEA